MSDFRGFNRFGNSFANIAENRRRIDERGCVPALADFGYCGFRVGKRLRKVARANVVGGEEHDGNAETFGNDSVDVVLADRFFVDFELLNRRRVVGMRENAVYRAFAGVITYKSHSVVTCALKKFQPQSRVVLRFYFFCATVHDRKVEVVEVSVVIPDENLVRARIKQRVDRGVYLFGYVANRKVVFRHTRFKSGIRLAHYSVRAL